MRGDMLWPKLLSRGDSTERTKCAPWNSGGRTRVRSSATAATSSRSAALLRVAAAVGGSGSEACFAACRFERGERGPRSGSSPEEVSVTSA